MKRLAFVVTVLALVVFAVGPTRAADPTDDNDDDVISASIRPRPAEAPRPIVLPPSPTAFVDAGLRVWPLAPGEYGFSQPFGCVPQLGFYIVMPGCPADAPAMHSGIDLAAPSGTIFYAAAAGLVTEAGLDRDEGIANTRLIIVHNGPNNGWATEYLHWRAAYVQPGQVVAAGQALGEVGSVGYSTGPHLHFGVLDLTAGSWGDPLAWLPADPSGGAYLGVSPDSVFVSYPEVSAGVPDYADPDPPPPPVIADAPAATQPTASPPPGATSTPTAAPPDQTAVPTHAPTEIVIEPTPEPTLEPTLEPTAEPTVEPPPDPTEEPPPDPPVDEPPSDGGSPVP